MFFLMVEYIYIYKSYKVPIDPIFWVEWFQFDLISVFNELL